MPRADSPLVLLVLDPAGAGSPLAAAARRAGHHVMTATGIETALVVIGGVTPDAIVIPSTTLDHDRRLTARLAAHAPDIPVHFVPSAAVATFDLDLPARSAN